MPSRSYRNVCRYLLGMSSSSNFPDRLDFVLPDFTRLAWVSERARGVWEPRLRCIRRAWSDIEWASVLFGVRSCSLVQLSLEALISSASTWARHGLSTLPLGVQGRSDLPYVSSTPAPKLGKPVALRVVVGSLPNIVHFKKAWESNDSE